MQAIREVIEVKSNKFTFDLPDDFISKKIEIIILPYETKVQDKEKFAKKAFLDLAGKIDIDENAVSQLRQNSII